MKGKLPVEVKIEAVEEYLNGKSGMKSCARKYGVSETTLQTWIRLYETRGVEGLMPSLKFRKYSAKTKTGAVTDYLSGKGSMHDICKKYNISTRSMLERWIKWYNGHGDFKQPKTGGSIYMIKGRETTLDERIEIVSHCVSNNKDYGKTIEKYGISYQQLYGWVRKYEQNGVDGLVDRRGKRKDKDSMNEVEKLRAQLKLKDAENIRLQMENELLKKLEALERGRDAD